MPRSQFCFLCGTGLRNSCTQCNEPITSLTPNFLTGMVAILSRELVKCRGSN
ncbi:hypothetical protein [Nostoc sp. DSM 114159]